MFVALGLVDRDRDRSRNLSATHAVPAPATGWLVALIPIMFSYSGWNAAAYVAEEIRNPGRNVPIALALGTGAVVAPLPRAQCALSLRAAARRAGRPAEPGQGLTDVVAQRLFGGVAGTLLALLTIVSIAGEHQRHGARRAARVLRDGARRRVPARRSRACTRASARRRSRLPTQAVWSSILVLVGHARGARQLHRLCRDAVRRRRGHGGVRAALARARRRPGRSARGAIRSRRRSSSWPASSWSATTSTPTSSASAGASPSSPPDCRCTSSSRADTDEKACLTKLYRVHCRRVLAHRSAHASVQAASAPSVSREQQK